MSVRVVLLGPPGSGKGTQGRRLAEAFGVPHISSGELLRRSIEAGDPYNVAEAMAIGLLVEDTTLHRILLDHLPEGFILDGYPRTAAQANALDEVIAPAALDAVIEIRVPEEELRSRLLERAAEGRVDDAQETIARRIDIYRNEVAALRQHYKDRLVVVDGTGTPDEVFERLVEAIRSRQHTT